MDECLGDMTVHIPAVETGLSSDPEMNWRAPAVFGKTVVSFSDAHSLPNMGRELTVFEGEPGYLHLASGLKRYNVEQTIELFPEERKYSLTGHRRCGISQTPDEINLAGTKCPECGRSLTLGVLHRVWELGSESQMKGEDGPAYVKLTPLLKLLARTMQRGLRWSVGLTTVSVTNLVGRFRS